MDSILNDHELSLEMVSDSVTAAIQLLGNANAAMTCFWREKVTASINKTLVPLAKEDANFEEWPQPCLARNLLKGQRPRWPGESPVLGWRIPNCFFKGAKCILKDTEGAEAHHTQGILWVFTKNDSLHRRHTSTGRVQGTSARPGKRAGVPPIMPGVHYKQKEVSLRTNTVTGIPGSHSENNNNGVEPSSQQMKVIQVEARKLEREELILGPSPLAPPEEDECHISGDPPPSPLFYRHLQMTLSQILLQSAQDYDTPLYLTRECKGELAWWDNYMVRWNGKTMLKREIDLTIDSDASRLGWRQPASTKGWEVCGLPKRGRCLELLAATLATWTFAKNMTEITILLRLDNTSAVVYINNWGGTVS